jgi:type I restriction-modification system DNA methylase subunit
VPTASGKDKFFAKLEALIAVAGEFKRRGFDLQEPEEATKQLLLEPLLQALGFTSDSNYTREFKIIGDSVDYLLKSERPLIFVEAKSLLDKAENLFTGHREQVQRYIRNYRVSPEQVRMERPVAWIVLTNFAQFHFIRVNEETPTFSFALNDLWKRREEFWELLALNNLETGRIEELYEQRHKAGLDQRFLADLKRWRLLLVNGFALRNQTRSLDDITHASQQLLNRFLFSRMLETNQLIEWNKLARAYSHYEVFHGDFTEKTFAESLRESLFQEIKFKFNTELFKQPLLCDTLALDNNILSILVGHEPLSPEVAATCGFESGQGELLAFRHLYSYDFSLMSSDVMGAVYEKFLAHKLAQKDGRIVVEDTDELRKKEGIYYTPRYIVDYIVAHTLGEKIKPVLAEAKALLGYKNFKGAYDKICELSQIKVLDPAMGSGSFLLGAFDALAAAYNDYNAECERQKRNGGNGDGNGDALFDAPVAKPRPVERLGTAIVSHNLFGVDLDAQAVEVAKLNLWIRLMAAEKDSLRMKLQDPNKGKEPQNLLPALTSNFKHGNSLIDDANVAGDAAFDWKKNFPEIMKHGFDVVIGNPPYGASFSDNDEKNLAENFESFRKGVRDVYACFLEQSFRLAGKGAKTGFIVPSAWLGGPDYQPLREKLLEWKIETVIDLPFDVFIDAYVDTAIALFAAEKSNKENKVKTFAYPKKFKIEKIQIEESDYGFVTQEDWSKTPGSKFILDSKAHSLIGRIRERNPKQFADYFEMKRGVLFDPQLLTPKKNGARSFPYFEGDVYRYALNADFKSWIVFDDKIKERPAEFHWFEGQRILLRRLVNRQQRLMAAVAEETFITNKNLYSIRTDSQKCGLYTLLGILNSRLASFLYTRQVTQATKDDFPQVTIEDICGLPCPELQKSKLAKIVEKLAEQISKSQSALWKGSQFLQKKILHDQDRKPCNLAHYLQKDFSGAFKWDKLIADVQQAGFVHEIKIESAGSQITLSVTVTDKLDGEPQPLPVLQLTFKDEALRQFIYASWRQFLNENSRKHKWTKGKKPEPIYPLLVNLLEPLVYFNASAGDNLRAIRDLMKAVAAESGSADLAAIESVIKKLDTEIDQRVYELYGLTPEDIKIVEDIK